MLGIRLVDVRALLLSIFFFIAITSYSQSGKDTVLNISAIQKITKDSISTTDSIKNINELNHPKTETVKILFDSKDSTKATKDSTSTVSKDSTKQNRSDSTLKKEVSALISATIKEPSLDVKTDTTKYKSQIPHENKEEKLLTNKEANLIKKVVKDTAKFDQQVKEYNYINNTIKDTAKYKQQLKKFRLKQDRAELKTELLAKKDTLLSKGKTEIKSFKPKAIIFLKQQEKAIFPKGNIAVGYEYGVLPFVAGSHYPAGGYKAEGKISFLIINVPLELTFHYTDIKNTVGLNNYFRVSYDVNRYKDQLENELSGKEKSKIEQLSKLQTQEQKLMQKIEFLNYLKKNPNYHIPIDKKIISKNILTGVDSFDKDSLTSLVDTSGLSPAIGKNNISGSGVSPILKHQGDSLKNVNSTSNKLDSATVFKNATDNLKKKDSISAQVNFYKSKYDSINKLITRVKKEIEQIKNLQNGNSSITNPYLSKIQNILSGIKKFEIGLCNPTYSTFLVNNIPLQGIDMEYLKNNKFFAFAYGTTINNLLYNTNTVQGQMQGIRNTYNYFDFTNLSAGRKVLSLKGGVGAKEDSHIYVGFMAGKGRTDYLLPVSDPNSTSRESNIVMELDAKYKFSEALSADVVLGKSSVKEEDLTMEVVKKAVNEIFSGHRSNALLTKINFGIKKTNTKLTFTTRWVDPYFKSFGIGFLRSDNLRFEIKAEQQITSRIKYTVAYRKEEDNLLKLYNYKNTLHSVNNSLSIKISRHFNIRLNYIPLFRELKSNTIIIKDKNQIFTTILSYTPKAKKITSQFNFLYSKYVVTADSNNINFENFTYTHQLLFKSGFKTGLNVSWLKNSLKDTLNNDTYLGVLDVGYVAKNGETFSIGGKAAYKVGMEMQYGFILKASIKIYKGLFWEAQAEKILIGDYYNNIIFGEIKRFPYYCSTRLVFNF